MLVLACAGSSFAEPPRIEVLAWGGPPASVEHYNEMAEAGFTISYSGFGDVAAALAALDMARQAGIKLLVSCPQLQSDPEGTVARLKAHPALSGYYLRDEPSANDFAALREWMHRLAAVDPDHPGYVNLFPNYATPDQLGVANYQLYLDAFQKAVPVPFLSFDHYPVIQTPQGTIVRPQWYENLERVSAAAARGKVPMWAFALSTRHFDYPTATVAHLRLQVFTDLAYGAQCIQYFTYWQSAPFADAPVGTDGKRTVVYDRVKQVNQEVRGLSSMFAGARVVSLGHTGDTLPAGTKRFDVRSPVASVKTGTAGAVVSLLENGTHHYLVIVSHDVNQALPVSVTLDSTAGEASLVNKDGTLHPLNGSALDTKLESGDMAVIRWTAAPLH
jgi:hypothetical protein